MSTEHVERDVKYASGIFGLTTEDDSIQWETEKLVSFSQYSKYLKCPKSWELRYIRKHRVSQKSIALVYGTAMHTTIQTFLKQLYTVSVKSANALDLNAILLEEMKTGYMKEVESNNGVHFSSKEQLGEYYADGIQILEYLKKKRNGYFSTKTMKLVAIELPMTVKPDESRPNIKLQQHLDLVFYHPNSNKYSIIDIKTSRTGWNQYKKKDKSTTDQLLLYKKHFSEKFNIPIDDISIEYFILRQKIDPDSLWPMKRISQFRPASGKVSLKKLSNEFQKFINECFDESGNYIDKSYPAIGGKNMYNCRFCEYNSEEFCPSKNRITIN